MEYCVDIFKMRTNDVIFKTARFTKRNFLWFCSKINLLGYKLALIKHEIKHAIHGFKIFGKDIKWVAGYRYDKFIGKRGKYETQSYSEAKRIREVRLDLFKFIPFSLFIIIPGMELLLPVWLIIFPNSKPSQW